MNIQKRSKILLLAASVVIVFLYLLFSDRLGDFGSFLYLNFVLPLGNYYTPVNTVVYGLILAMAVPLVSRLLSMLKVKVDEKFFYSIIPYILIGSSARALEDYIESTYQERFIFLVSPPIYFVIFGYALACLMLSLFLCRRLGWSFHTLFFTLGSILLAYLAYMILFVAGLKNADGIILVIEFTFSAALVSVPIIILTHRIVGFKSLPITILIIVAHLLDASATHVAVSYFPYIEQHPLPALLANIFGTTIVLIPIKFLALLSITVALDRFFGEEDKQLIGVLKITLLTLGLATGMRDLLSLGMKV